MFRRAIIMLLVLVVRHLGLFLSGGAVAALERLAPRLKQPSPQLRLICAAARVSVSTKIASTASSARTMLLAVRAGRRTLLPLTPVACVRQRHDARS